MSRRQTLATFLQFSQGLSDRAGWLLAKSLADGVISPEVETLVRPDGDTDERDRVYSAFSLMRGDQKKGRILGIQTDFTDGTAMNRVQLGLYGFQQSVLGLVTDTAGMARDAALWTYAKTALSESERRDFFAWWDARARAEQAMKQQLPDAQGFAGEAFQGVMENLHWFIPYWAVGKGGKMVTAARGLKEGDAALKGWKKVFQPLKDLKVTLTPMRLGESLKEEKAVYEAGRAAMLADAARAEAAAGAAYSFADAEFVAEGVAAIVAPRQIAAVERYTQMLRAVDKDLKAAAKWWKDAAGTGMWTAGEASAFSAFASEYVANADAAGVSREESVLTAAAIGLVNAKIEQLYVPGLESSLSPAQIKSLTFAAMAQAIRSDGAAGFRKWLANRINYGVREGVKVAATEGLVEEPLQQMAVEHGKAFDRLCQELRKNGQATLADEAKALWTSFAETLPQDYATFIDTAADMLPSSVGFGVTAVGNMTRRQHVHNVVTRHANRRAGSTATDTMFNLALGGEDPSRAFDYDAGIVEYLQRAVDVRNAVEKHWRGEGEGQKNPHRFEEAITAARQAFRNPQTGDVVSEVAKAAGVDVKTAEVLAQYLQTEAEAAAFSPTVRAWMSLNMSLADIDEQTIKTVLPGYVEGSFASDPDAGVYSGKVRLADGTERTIAYRVGDFSEELRAEADENAKIGSAFGDSWNARHEELGDGLRWESLSDAQRYTEALFASNAASMGRGAFELTDAKGGKVRVNADDVIRLSNGHIADIGYGPAATQATVRHETFHALWRFVRTSLEDADVQSLAKTLGVDVTNKNWERQLDEKMAHQMERYASGHYVSHAVSSRFDKMLEGFAGKAVKFFAQFGQRDEVTDPQTGKPYQLKGLYDKILRGELGSGALGVELSKLPARPAAPASPAPRSTLPVEVTDAERAAAEAEAREEAAREEPPAPAAPASPAPTVAAPAAPVSTSASVPAATAENPADASAPNQRHYRVGLPNSNVKLVGRLEVRDAETGLVTSTDAGYHDRGNQNRDDKSEESRALVQKIGANPDPLQVGTVQPIASNGVVWTLPNGDVIIGNHRVNGVRLAYGKGTAAELEKFVRGDAAKRGIEVGADVKKPLLVFVLERIESPDGKADVREVVRLANESQNRGFNVREQASNDAKILLDNNLLPRMAFRADGRIDETKSGDAIGVFRRETGAQGMIAGDGSLTEEGQTRIQNAALAVLLGGEGTGALLQKIMSNAGRLDMQNELRALMKMTPELMALSEDKSDYDLRAPLAEALRLFTEWRGMDESARVEKGKTRRDWRETKDGKRVRGVSWGQFTAQGDLFSKPSEEAKILGDLFAKAESLRSFDREDAESDAGKKRAVDLITGYLEDYIGNVRAVNTETEDMFGFTPATRAEVMKAQREKPGPDGGPRFSVNPNLRADIDEALNTDPAKGAVVKGGKRVVFGRSQRLFPALGLSDGVIYSKAYALRKIAADHKLTAEQIASAPDLMEEPAAVFDDNGKGYVFLTEAIAPDEDGVDAPVMFYVRPDGGGNYIASAYARKEKAESKYVNLVNAGKVLYFDKNKIARLPLRGEAQSSLITFSAGDSVVTPEGLTARSIAQTGGAAQGDNARFSVAPEQDAAYMDAVKRGDMESAGRMVREAAASQGWHEKSTKETLTTLGITANTFDEFQTFARIWISGEQYAVSGKTIEDRKFDSLKDAVKYLADNGFDGGISKGRFDQEFSSLPDSLKGVKFYQSPSYTVYHHTTKQIYDYIQSKKTADTATGESVYIRFGKLPKGGRSRNYAEGFDEPGVSVFAGLRLRDGSVFVTPETPQQLGTLIHARAQGRPVFIATGDVNGRGSDGEPTLANAKIVPVKEYTFTPPTFFVKDGTVKRTDVTRDDAGNVIPLSQRFNQQNPDIRFSTVAGLSEKERRNLGAAQTEAQRVLDRIGGTELGNAVNRDFRGEGRTTLIGKTVRRAEDLAALAQIYRNPCFETFRYFFTKNGEVVWQTGVTERLPGVTNCSVDTPEGNTYAEIERMAAKLKPDGVWLLHNHPSGSVAPSQADIDSTNRLREYFDRQHICLDGHVIIDHDTYAELDRRGNYPPRRIDASGLDASYHGKPYDNPPNGTVAIGNPFRGPGKNFGLSDIAGFFMKLQLDAAERGKVLTFIAVDTRANSVVSVANVPAEKLVAGRESLSQTLADYRGATGGYFLFVVGDQAIGDYGKDAGAALRRQMEIGNVTDFLWGDATGRDWTSVRSSETFTLDSKGMKRLGQSRLGRVDLGEARYSIAARLDEERQELEAKGGKLLLAHHGTDSAGFTVFEKTDDLGYFFAKSRSTAGSYIHNGSYRDVDKKALPDY